MPYPTNQLTELLTLKKTSEILKVHPNTLRQWDKKGILKAVRFGNRKDRHYKKEDILRMLDEELGTSDFEETKNYYTGENYIGRKTFAEQALERLSFIQNITSALSRALTAEETIEIFLSESMKGLGASRVILFKLDPSSKKLLCLGHIGFPSEYIEKAQLLTPDAHSLYFDVLKSGEPIILENFENVSSAENYSFGCIPITTGTKVLAALGVYLNSESSTLNKEAISFILTMARQFALSLERAYFFEAERSARAEAEYMQSLLHQAYNSSLKFLVPLTPQETYSTIVLETMKLLGADYGSLFLNNKNKPEKVYSTFPILYKVGSRPRGFGNTALQTNQILVNQVSKDEYHQLLVKIGIKTIIYVPMAYQNKTFGLITLNFLTTQKPTEKEFSILRLLGSLASLAIERFNTPTLKKE